MTDLFTSLVRLALRRSALFGCALALAAGLAGADDAEVGALLADAERSMTDGDFVAGVNRYLAAAQAGDKVETARQATITAYLFGFDAVTVAAAERWAQLDATPWRAQVYGAMAVLRSGDSGGAVTRLRDVLDDGVAPADVCGLLDDGLSRSVRNDDAQAALSKLARRYDEVPCLSRLAASAALSAEDYDDAERHLERMADMGAFDNDARLVAMARLIALEDVDAALGDDALRLDDTASVEQRIEYAFLHARAEQNDTARNMLELLRSEHPEDPDVLEQCVQVGRQQIILVGDLHL